MDLLKFRNIFEHLYSSEMRLKIHISILLILCFGFLKLRSEEQTKTGFNLGVLPAISFNTDEGFQYGAILNLFNYGDGGRYPKYDHSYYLEASKYTKGSTVLRFYFDSDKLLDGTRTFADISYIDESLLDFYGFNGYQSVYDHNLELTNRAWYKLSQKQLRMLLDFKGSTPIQNLYWTSSINIVRYKNASVNYDKLNSNPNFPDIQPEMSLYEKYLEWGLIQPEEANGSLVNSVKAGFIIDTRKRLNNPNTGIYTEAIIELAPKFANKIPYSRFSLLHRQYVELVENKLNLAGRIGIQGQLGKHRIPFYRLPVMMSPFANRTNPSGLGGASSLRGILRNRIIGDMTTLGNLELRWKAMAFKLAKQNIYIGFNTFSDAGYILKPLEMDLSAVPELEKPVYFDLQAKESLHSSYGLGIKLAMNENFIISGEWGSSIDKRDGKSGMYINLNYLF